MAQKSIAAHSRKCVALCFHGGIRARWVGDGLKVGICDGGLAVLCHALRAHQRLRARKNAQPNTRTQNSHHHCIPIACLPATRTLHNMYLLLVCSLARACFSCVSCGSLPRRHISIIQWVSISLNDASARAFAGETPNSGSGPWQKST